MTPTETPAPAARCHPGRRRPPARPRGARGGGRKRGRAGPAGAAGARHAGGRRLPHGDAARVGRAGGGPADAAPGGGGAVGRRRLGRVVRHDRLGRRLLDGLPRRRRRPGALPRPGRLHGDLARAGRPRRGGRRRLPGQRALALRQRVPARHVDGGHLRGDGRRRPRGRRVRRAGPAHVLPARRRVRDHRHLDDHGAARRAAATTTPRPTCSCPRSAPSGRSPRRCSAPARCTRCPSCSWPTRPACPWGSPAAPSTPWWRWPPPSPGRGAGVLRDDALVQAAVARAEALLGSAPRLRLRRRGHGVGRAAGRRGALARPTGALPPSPRVRGPGLRGGRRPGVPHGRRPRPVRAPPAATAPCATSTRSASTSCSRRRPSSRPGARCWAWRSSHRSGSAPARRSGAAPTPASRLWRLPLREDAACLWSPRRRPRRGA